MEEDIDSGTNDWFGELNSPDPLNPLLSGYEITERIAERLLNALPR